MSNFDAFMRETKKAIEAERAKQVSEGKKIVLAAYGAIVNLSPVDKGLFKNSNILTYNSVDTKVYDKVDEGNINRGKSEIATAKLNDGDTITIQNRLLYSDALEAGHSTQAPLGIYGVVEERTRTILAKKRTL